MIRKVRLSFLALPLSLARAVILLGVGCSKKPTDAQLGDQCAEDKSWPILR